MAQQLLNSHHTLICISRTSDSALDAEAGKGDCAIEQWTENLAYAEPVSRRLRSWLSVRRTDEFVEATLINNAGMIPEIGPLRCLEAVDLSNAMRVGLEAPMQLTAVFLRGTENWRAERRVLNISSGLGRHATASQAAYCAAKAELDHFTRCLALEEAQKEGGAKVCSLAPGVIDTKMQEQFRSADAGAFPDLSNFTALKRAANSPPRKKPRARCLPILTETTLARVPWATCGIDFDSPGARATAFRTATDDQCDFKI
jgi:benzil reductase ((S)-benzoin forming)